jgi:hypothetical protein
MITYKIGFFLDYSSARKTKEDENSFFKKITLWWFDSVF